MAQIAVLGTGTMGTPIAYRLLAAGHTVAVWNRTAARTAGPVSAGATATASPAEAVAGADVVVTMVRDGPAVRAVLEVAAPALRPGACVVEMSTIGPAWLDAVAAVLPPGVDLVDAPVAGSADAAASGRLRIFAGGTDAALDWVEPVLAALGTVRRCGGPGTGARLKVVLNAALGTAAAAVADTLAIADALGVDRSTALEALAGGALGRAVERLGGGGSFAIALAAKDLDLAVQAVPAADAVPVVRAAAASLRGFVDQDADLSALVK